MPRVQQEGIEVDVAQAATGVRSMSVKYAWGDNLESVAAILPGSPERIEWVLKAAEAFYVKSQGCLWVDPLLAKVLPVIDTEYRRWSRVRFVERMRTEPKLVLMLEAVASAGVDELHDFLMNYGEMLGLRRKNHKKGR